MPGLHDVVQGLAAREGVEAVIVVSPDGLPIDQAVKQGVDAEAVAALTATVAQGARGLGHVVECRSLATGVLEFDNRNVVFSSVGDDNFLFVLTAAGTNIGHLLYDLRRHGPALRSLL